MVSPDPLQNDTLTATVTAYSSFAVFMEEFNSISLIWGGGMYAREQFHKAGPRLCIEECILTGDPDTVVHMHQSPADKKGLDPH